MLKTKLIGKLQDRSAVIGVVGLGYVGLPLVLAFAEAGFQALGLDIDEERTQGLNQGQGYIKHISEDRIRGAVDSGRFSAHTDFGRAKEADALILCVPTPLDKHQKPNLSFVINTVEALVPHLRPGQVISLESTTYPGTTEEELLPRVESTGLKVGKDLFLVYSPEREDPANPDFTIQTIPKICGGVTEACLEVGQALYGSVVEQVIPVSSTRTAEMTKLLENIHRAVNIGLVNEMKVLADKMGIDIYEVIRSAATKPFGFVPYYPGPGLGGHCIPIDPFYLAWKAREYGLRTRFIELAGEVNTAMPAWVVDKIVEAMNVRGKAVKGSKILVLGIAYKKNVDDTRESPAVVIMEMLHTRGAEIGYSDPHIPTFPRMREHQFELASVELTPESLRSQDCVVLATDHDDFDYKLIRKHAPLIVDARGVYRDAGANIIKA